MMKEEQKYMTPLYLDKRIFFLVQSIIMLNAPRQGFHKMCACVKLAMIQAVSEHVPNCNAIKLGARSLLLQSTSTLTSHPQQPTNIHLLFDLPLCHFTLRCILPRKKHASNSAVLAQKMS